MEHIVERRGPITLFFSKAGFAWVMTSKSGMHWYWHPETRHWTGRPSAAHTIRQATAGLGPYGPWPEEPSATLMRAPLGRRR
jgi:hypothetical protein